MEEVQYSKFYKSPITQITVIWTICFLVGPLISLGIGLTVGNVSWLQAWSMTSRDPWTYIFFGLVIAESMSGLFTALILQRKLPKLKFHHIILFTLGWGVAALVSWFVLSILVGID